MFLKDASLNLNEKVEDHKENKGVFLSFCNAKRINVLRLSRKNNFFATELQMQGNAEKIKNSKQIIKRKLHSEDWKNSVRETTIVTSSIPKALGTESFVSEVSLKILLLRL